MTFIHDIPDDATITVTIRLRDAIALRDLLATVKAPAQAWISTGDAVDEIRRETDEALAKWEAKRAGDIERSKQDDA